MPMSATTRPSGLGPSTDPGQEGWDALGMGIHFTLGNGSPGGLLGNLPYDQRLQAAHAGDANADWPNSAPAGFNQAQADLSLLGANYGGTPASIFSAADSAQLDNDNLLAMQKYLSEGVGYTVPLDTARQALTSSWKQSGFGYDVGQGNVSNPGAPVSSAQPQTFKAQAATFEAPSIAPSIASSTPQASAVDAPTTAPSAFKPSAAATAASSSPLTQVSSPTTPTATAMPYSYDLPGYIGHYSNTSPGAVTGTAGHAGAGAYGTVPNVPDPVLTANQAIYGNLANLGGIEVLGSGLNSYNQDELLKEYETALPGYNNLVSQSSRNIASKLAGQVPADVLEQIQQRAAERGIGSGSYLDDNQSAAYLKALGLTSLDLQNQGEEQLTGAIKRTPTAQLFNPGSFLVSPEDAQAAQWAANQFAAAPDPTLAAQEAERKALEGINAGKASVGGGGTSVLPSGGSGAINPVSGTAFNPFSGGGSLPTGLGGRTNTSTGSTSSADEELMNWWENMFGEGSYQQDFNQPPTTTQTGTGTQDDQLANWWDNMFGEGSWESDMYGDGSD